MVGTFRLADMASQVEPLLIDALYALDVVDLLLAVEETLWQPIRTRQVHPNTVREGFHDRTRVRVLNHLEIVVKLLVVVLVLLLVLLEIHSRTATAFGQRLRVRVE
jgi:uncharacterized membrane protein